MFYSNNQNKNDLNSIGLQELNHYFLGKVSLSVVIVVSCYYASFGHDTARHWQSGIPQRLLCNYTQKCVCVPSSVRLCVSLFGNVLTHLPVCPCVIPGAVQWPGNLRSLVRRGASAWNSRNEESPDCLRRKYLPSAKSVTDREDSLPVIGLFLRAVVRSAGQISQIHLSWKNSLTSFLVTSDCASSATNWDDQFYLFLIIQDFVTNVIRWNHLFFFFFKFRAAADFKSVLITSRAGSQSHTRWCYANYRIHVPCEILTCSHRIFKRRNMPSSSKGYGD